MTHEACSCCKGCFREAPPSGLWACFREVGLSTNVNRFTDNVQVRILAGQTCFVQLSSYQILQKIQAPQ